MTTPESKPKKVIPLTMIEDNGERVVLGEITDIVQKSDGIYFTASLNEAGRARVAYEGHYSLDHMPARSRGVDLGLRDLSVDMEPGAYNAMIEKLPEVSGRIEGEWVEG